MARYIKEFESIHQFYRYLCDTPFNEVFRWTDHHSVTQGYAFAGTKSFDEAVELLKNGWTDMSTSLTHKLKVATKASIQTKPRNVLSVSGYQPVVPLYLAGVPTNMISKQMVPVKSKVVSVTKLINYHCGISTSVIEEESIKALQVVKQLEAQGYRVNLSVAMGSSADGKSIICKVKIKRAGEKLNVSKLAFPMVHPSMLRRLMLRYIEVCPDATKGYVGSYGMPCGFDMMKEVFPDDVVIPSICQQDVSKICNLEDLVANV